MASSENTDGRSSAENLVKLEAEYKKDKARVKSSFSRAKNRLIGLLDQQELPSRNEVQDACRRMDSCAELATDVLTNFSEFYIRVNEMQKSMRVSNEAEKLEDEYSSAYEAATEYLQSRQDERSSVTSDILSINMIEQINISETNERERPRIQRQDEVGTVISNNTSETTHETESERRNRNVRVGGFDKRHSHMTHTGQESHSKYEQSKMDITRRQTSLSGLDPHIAPFEPTHTCNREAPSIGQDLWRQLKRVQISVFHGDKRKYQSWKAAFLACIDNAPATAEYKLLQLRQYLSGEALQVIENSGHSATAYEAAKERLERKYGGQRRQIAAYLEDLDNFKQVRTGNAKDLEKFADLLDIAIINLQEAGQDHELENGSLYTKLQRKLSESMLPRYHRGYLKTT